MLDPDSRYAKTPTAEHVGPTGRRTVYLRRRFIDAGSTFTPIGRARITEGDRLDLVGFRTIGDPLQYWRICDANEAMNPTDLETPGRIVLIAVKE